MNFGFSCSPCCGDELILYTQGLERPDASTYRGTLPVTSINVDPIDDKPQTDWKYLSAEGQHAVDADGNLWSWGVAPAGCESFDKRSGFFKETFTTGSFKKCGEHWALKDNGELWVWGQAKRSVFMIDAASVQIHSPSETHKELYAYRSAAVESITVDTTKASSSYSFPAGVYTVPPIVTIAPPQQGSLQFPHTGSGAAAEVTLSCNVINITLTSGGSGYTSPPIISFSGGGGEGATAKAVIQNGSVVAVSMQLRGTGYSSPPSVSFASTDGNGSGAAATCDVCGNIASVTLTNGGSGYSTEPVITITRRSNDKALTLFTRQIAGANLNADARILVTRLAASGIVKVGWKSSPSDSRTISSSVGSDVDHDSATLETINVSRSGFDQRAGVNGEGRRVTCKVAAPSGSSAGTLQWKAVREYKDNNTGNVTRVVGRVVAEVAYSLGSGGPTRDQARTNTELTSRPHNLMYSPETSESTSAVPSVVGVYPSNHGAGSGASVSSTNITGSWVSSRRLRISPSGEEVVDSNWFTVIDNRYLFSQGDAGALSVIHFTSGGSGYDTRDVKFNVAINAGYGSVRVAATARGIPNENYGIYSSQYVAPTFQWIDVPSGATRVVSATLANSCPTTASYIYPAVSSPMPVDGGSGCVVSPVVSSSGQITSFSVINSGSGYRSTPQMLVRRYDATPVRVPGTWSDFSFRGKRWCALSSSGQIFTHKHGLSTSISADTKTPDWTSVLKQHYPCGSYAYDSVGEVRSNTTINVGVNITDDATKGDVYINHADAWTSFKPSTNDPCAWTKDQNGQVSSYGPSYGTGVTPFEVWPLYGGFSTAQYDGATPASHYVWISPSVVLSDVSITYETLARETGTGVYTPSVPYTVQRPIYSHTYTAYPGGIFQLPSTTLHTRPPIASVFSSSHGALNESTFESAERDSSTFLAFGSGLLAGVVCGGLTSQGKAWIFNDVIAAPLTGGIEWVDKAARKTGYLSPPYITSVGSGIRQADGAVATIPLSPSGSQDTATLLFYGGSVADVIGYTRWDTLQTGSLQTDSRLSDRPGLSLSFADGSGSGERGVGDGFLSTRVPSAPIYTTLVFESVSSDGIARGSRFGYLSDNNSELWYGFGALQPAYDIKFGLKRFPNGFIPPASHPLSWPALDRQSVTGTLSRPRSGAFLDSSGKVHTYSLRLQNDQGAIGSRCGIPIGRLFPGSATIIKFVPGTSYGPPVSRPFTLPAGPAISNIYYVPSVGFQRAKVSVASPPAILASIAVIGSGAGFRTAPSVSISGGGGSGAAAVAVIQGPISAINVTAAGSGYRSPPKVVVSESTGIPPDQSAFACSLGNDGGVSSISVSQLPEGPQSGWTSRWSVSHPYPRGLYSSAPSVTITPRNELLSISVANGGSGYNLPPSVVFASQHLGSGAAATAVIRGPVGTVTVISSGSGYKYPPLISFSPRQTPIGDEVAVSPGKDDFTAAINGSGEITGVTGSGGNYSTPPFVTASPRKEIKRVEITNGGSGYTSAPEVAFAGEGTLAEANCIVSGGVVVGVVIANGGRDYTNSSTVSFSGGGGSGAAGTVVVGDGPGQGAYLSAKLNASVYSVKVISHGVDYEIEPDVLFSGGGGSGATATAAVGPGPGSGATAECVIDGRILYVDVTSPGSGFTSEPTVTLSPANGASCASRIAWPIKTASYSVVSGGDRYNSDQPTNNISVPKVGMLCQPAAYNVGSMKYGIVAGPTRATVVGRSVSAATMPSLQNLEYSFSKPIAVVTSDYFSYPITLLKRAGVAFSRPLFTATNNGNGLAFYYTTSTNGLTTVSNVFNRYLNRCRWEMPSKTDAYASKKPIFGCPIYYSQRMPSSPSRTVSAFLRTQSPPTVQHFDVEAAPSLGSVGGVDGSGARTLPVSLSSRGSGKFRNTTTTERVTIDSKWDHGAVVSLGIQGGAVTSATISSRGYFGSFNSGTVECLISGDGDFATAAVRLGRRIKSVSFAASSQATSAASAFSQSYYQSNYLPTTDVWLPNPSGVPSLSPQVVFTGGSPSINATASVTFNSSQQANISLTNPGLYESTPEAHVVLSDGNAFALIVTMDEDYKQIAGVDVTRGGSGYTQATATISCPLTSKHAYSSRLASVGQTESIYTYDTIYTDPLGLSLSGSQLFMEAAAPSGFVESPYSMPNDATGTIESSMPETHESNTNNRYGTRQVDPFAHSLMMFYSDGVVTGGNVYNNFGETNSYYIDRGWGNTLGCSMDNSLEIAPDVGGSASASGDEHWWQGTGGQRQFVPWTTPAFVDVSGINGAISNYFTAGSPQSASFAAERVDYQ